MDLAKTIGVSEILLSKYISSFSRPRLETYQFGMENCRKILVDRVSPNLVHFGLLPRSL